MLKFIKVFLFIFSFLFSSFVFADESLELKSSSNSFLELEWDSNSDVFMYDIKYWQESLSGTTKNYPKSSDLFEENTYKLEWLEKDLEYFWVIYGYNSNWEIVYESWEFSYFTKEIDILYVLSSKNISKNEVEISFSNEISSENTNQIELRIEETNNQESYFDSIWTVVNPDDNKNIIVLLDRDLEVWVEYKIIVLSIKDIFGQTIEFWVNSETSFFWKNVEEKIKEELIIEEENEIIEKELIIEEKEELEEINNEPNNVWIELNSADVAEDLVSLSEKNEELPTTWPEHILLFILAILFSSLVFVYKFKKTS